MVDTVTGIVYPVALDTWRTDARTAGSRFRVRLTLDDATALANKIRNCRRNN